MSLDLTIRQKLVRVVASAAVCGLSLSFIIGEAVDQKAKMISQWSADSNFFPANYLPLRPVSATMAGISIESISQTIVAMNSRGSVPFAPAPPTNTVFQDSLRTILAAPISLPEADAEKISAKIARLEIVTPASAPLADEGIPTRDLESMLLSVHEATAALSENPPRAQSENSRQVASAGSVIKSLPEVVVLPAAKPEIVAQVQGALEMTTEEAPPTISELKTTDEGLRDWKIRGKLSVGANKLAPGHFEVSLFSKIDQDGVPVGFPIVQQILRTGTAEFELNVPAKVERGFLYGEFVATKGGKRTWIAPPLNPWPRGERQFADLVMSQEDVVTTVAASSTRSPSQSAEDVQIQGIVSTAFAPKNSPIYQEDVVVKVRGRKDSARTGKNGSFSLMIPKVKGVVYLEFLKAGYHPALVAVDLSSETDGLRVEIASRDAIDQTAIRLGVRQVATKAVFLGRAVDKDGAGLRGMTLQISGKVDGPYYFGDDGVASSQLKSTSGDGRALFFNIEPGTAFVEASFAGEPIAPFVVSTVEGGELVTKTLQPITGSMKGRLFNPVSANGRLQPVAGARIRVEGAFDWSTSDSYGAFSLGPMKWMKGERISIEFSAERYNNHRYLMIPDEKKPELNLYAFPANYLGKLAHSMDIDLDPSAGIVLGKVENLSVRIDAMADHSAVNAAKDFYFDSRGKLRGSYNLTDPKFGTYLIFNVPKGRTLLQGNDANGVLRYSNVVVSSPASISIVMD